jgi:tetratricopeptide (TPR) repeat protein
MILAGHARRLAGARIAPFIVGLAGFGVFAATLRYGFVYDDVNQILKNPWVWDIRHLPDLLSRSVWSFSDLQSSNYYRPVQMGLYFIDAQLFGRHPFAFHLTNVVMHSLVAAVFFLLLRRITGPTRALFAALLFAVHPVHVESVAWIAGSTDVNCALLILLTLLAWQRAGIAAAAGGPTVRWYLLTGTLFLLALLAKEIAVVTPVLALLLPRAEPVDEVGSPHRSKGRSGSREINGAWARRLGAAAPAFGGGLAIYIALRLQALGTLRPILARPDLSAGEVIGGGLGLIPRYLMVLVAPWRLIPDRVIERTEGPFEPLALLGAAIVVGAVAAVILLRRRAPICALGIALVFLPLAPVLRIDLFSDDHLPDRYLYLPSLGLALLMAELGAVVARRAAPALSRWAVPVAIALLAAGAVRTVTAAEMWRDDETLGRAGIELAPRSIGMHLVLITALDAAGRVDEAYEVARQAKAIDPEDRRVRAALSGLRARLEATGPEEAIAIYRTALAADARQPHLWTSLAASYIKAGEARKAIEAAESALKLDRYNTAAMLNLGTALGLTGDHAGQEREARRLLDLDPKSASGWLNLGAARLSQEDPIGGEEALRRAVVLEPTLARAHFYLSYIASRIGDRPAAVESARRAVDLEPGEAGYWNRLGVALARSGSTAEAGDAWRRALSIDPDHEQAAAYLERLREESTGG